MDLFTLKKCFNCPDRVVDIETLEAKLQQVMADSNFNRRLAARVDSKRPMHHQLFHIALAGCPNSCSQPQIKDFGVQGQAVPEVGEECNNCGACAGACPEGAISIGENRAAIDRNTCLNCGRCARVCPTGAMQLSKTGFKVLVGGKLGRRPRLAFELAAFTETDGVAAYLGRCVELFINEGRPGERFGGILERIPFVDQNFKEG